MVATLAHPGGIQNRSGSAQPVCPAAGLSFTLGLMALRLCWLPGVNLVLALGALGAGTLGCYTIARSRGRLCGFDEAISGMVMAVVVVGLSVFFISALVGAWR